jgi:two-component system LytT family response regulator
MNREAGTKIRAVIVDDEELARQVLREFLSAHPEIELMAECANGFEAVKSVTELKPDLLFLDIQMPKLDGFEVLELIGSDVRVIFVTAFDSYAIKAFEVHAVDYLLKPFGADRFEAALNRAKEGLAGKKSAHPEMPAADLAAAARPPSQ